MSAASAARATRMRWRSKILVFTLVCAPVRGIGGRRRATPRRRRRCDRRKRRAGIPRRRARRAAARCAPRSGSAAGRSRRAAAGRKRKRPGAPAGDGTWPRARNPNDDPDLVGHGDLAVEHHRTAERERPQRRVEHARPVDAVAAESLAKSLGRQSSVATDRFGIRQRPFGFDSGNRSSCPLNGHCRQVRATARSDGEPPFAPTFWATNGSHELPLTGSRSGPNERNLDGPAEMAFRSAAAVRRGKTRVIPDRRDTRGDQSLS
jgi:hypothetical protein